MPMLLLWNQCSKTVLAAHEAHIPLTRFVPHLRTTSSHPAYPFGSITFLYVSLGLAYLVHLLYIAFML